MAVDYNRVILGGNMTRDPELRFTSNGIPVCNFGLAVNRQRSKTDEVDFFDITVWRELGEVVAQYKVKGDPLLIEGKLQQRTYEDRQGNKRNAVDVVADSIQFLGRGSTTDTQQGGQAAQGGQQRQTNQRQGSQQTAQRQRTTQRQQPPPTQDSPPEFNDEDIPF